MSVLEQVGVVVCLALMSGQLGVPLAGGWEAPAQLRLRMARSPTRPAPMAHTTAYQRVLPLFKSWQSWDYLQ